MPRLKDIYEFSVRSGIAFPTAESYGGLSGFYDWGRWGSLIKNRVKNFWLNYFVRSKDFIVQLDGSIITHPSVWKASGHADSFVDPVTVCESCGAVYRADHLIEDVLDRSAEGLSLEEMKEVIKNIRCPRCGGKLKDPEPFNLMFTTIIGPYSGMKGYLRPETAQLIFVDFPRLYMQNRKRVPFGVAQTGKAFRNEISPRNFLFRLREFEQMEIEFFFDPENPSRPPVDHSDIEVKILTASDQMEGRKEETKRVGDVVGDYPGREWMVYWIGESLKFFESIGIDMERIRVRQQLPEERAHYSMDTWDIEFFFDDLGWKEIEGIAHRSDYDLSRHKEFSGDNSYVVKSDEREFIPWVVEPSWGVERTIMALLYSSYRSGEREYLSLKPWIAPIDVVVLPLLSKEPLTTKAVEVTHHLVQYFWVEYDDKGSIGKRYRRYDQIGVPYAVTVDHTTLEDGTVTVRERDSMEQERVRLNDLVEYLWERVKFKWSYQKLY